MSLARWATILPYSASSPKRIACLDEVNNGEINIDDSSGEEIFNIVARHSFSSIEL